jgi:hypothetical protein
MFIDPADLQSRPDVLEEIEKASARLVTQALFEFRQEAAEIFAREQDKPQDVAEDITREALDRLGVSKMDSRLPGKIDYKRARYLFHPQYAIRQALLVDSKAEKEGNTATLQTAQTSLRIRHMRSGVAVDEAGGLPAIAESDKGNCITTSIVVKYEYSTEPTTRLLRFIVAAVPNGFLQSIYNPTATDTIWRVGRHAPSLGEAFRVRLVFDLLKQKMRWRVQRIEVPRPPRRARAPAPAPSFPWDE